MLYPKSVYDPVLGARYSSAYLKVENAVIKLSSYNYKHYKNKRKIEVKEKPGHWGRDNSIVWKFRAGF